ncbi:phage portal protein [Chitinimonas arctica]|uniref:Phage portal protein n=1 Tax=Chitinimonas arctica TaxID=2594795 RepID=A0A516S9V9_9NEIS|nr:phage portal protein [Chitinimonas arctica]QDQ24940.1 phage portal protein [Chitinimonas arctica]
MKRYPQLARQGFLLPGRLQALASYEAGGEGRRARNWQPGEAGPTSSVLGNLASLRSRSRAAYRNDPYACSSVDRIVSNTIGTGIAPKPKHADPTIRALLQELWDDWVEESDADGATDFYGQQALVCRTVEVAGECFVRLRPRKLSDGLAVPLQLQVLEPEFVPHTKHELTANGNVIRAGIEFNAIGQRAAYWMYRAHPGEGATPTSAYNDLVRIPADQVLHIRDVQRAGQLRGVPGLASVLVRLKHLDEFEDAVLFRQEVANLFAGFIRKPAPDDPPLGADGLPLDQPGDFAPMVGLEPGTMQELLPGEEVEFSTPPDAGNNYGDYIRQQLQAVAAGRGLPYELLTGDLRGVSDRVIRVVLNEFQRRIEQIQFGLYVHQLCRPVRAAWLDAAVLAGAAPLPNYPAQRRAYLRTRWVPQAWKYLHPLQDVQTRQEEVKAGFKSRDEVALSLGYDAETIDAENAAALKRAQGLGLVYSTDPVIQPKTTKETA